MPNPNPAKRKSWIRFMLRDDVDPKKKTEEWRVVSNSRIGVLLGDVKWYSGWRRYSFFPNGDLYLVFEQDCLRDIADFCETQTRNYKARRSADAAVTREREAEAVSSVQCGQNDPVEFQQRADLVDEKRFYG